MRPLRVGLLLPALTLLLSGCFSGGGYEPQDSAPPIQLNPALISDATPRRDPVTRAGNKNPYTVLGQTYYLLPTSEGYRARGVASWYGMKFHGRPTANGEPYDLYGMTAAHKTLPIPCYVRVTNLNNGRAAVVRVNDRGPFHDDRLIDLSYAAAVKLGFAEQGTAPVEIEVIGMDNSPAPMRLPTGAPSNVASGGVSASLPAGRYLQAGAFLSEVAAQGLQQKLSAVVQHPVRIERAPPYFRVRIGPLESEWQLTALARQLELLELTPAPVTVE